jgi:hypothetical protein
MKEDEIDRAFADGLLGIFINVASEGLKYLVFYSNEINEPNQQEGKNENQNQSDSESKNPDSTNKENSETADLNSSLPTPNPKRMKLDYDSFVEKLM